MLGNLISNIHRYIWQVDLYKLVKAKSKTTKNHWDLEAEGFEPVLHCFLLENDFWISIVRWSCIFLKCVRFITFWLNAVEKLLQDGHIQEEQLSILQMEASKSTENHYTHESPCAHVVSNYISFNLNRLCTGKYGWIQSLQSHNTMM